MDKNIKKSINVFECLRNSIKIASSGKAEKLRIDFVSRIGKHLFFTGIVSSKFTLKVIEIDRGILVKPLIQFLDDVDDNNHHEIWFAVIINTATNYLALRFQWDTLYYDVVFKSQYIQKDYHHIEKYIPIMARWAFLREIGTFSTEWHEFICACPINFIVAIPHQGLCDEDIKILTSLIEILKVYEPDGWTGNIDVVTINKINGWIKKINSDESQYISIHIDKKLLKDKIFASIFREDLYRLDVGTANYGYNVENNYLELFENELSVVSIVEPQTEKILAFRMVFTSALMPHTYKVIEDKYSPKVRGWSIATEYPDIIYNLDLFIDDIFYATAKNDLYRGDLKKKNISNGNGGFQFDSPAAFLGGGSHQITYRFPDGTFSMPFKWETPGPKVHPLWDLEILDKRVSIIIPIYNAAEDLRLCLDALLRHASGNCRYILVDDCSDDPQIGEILNIHAADEKFEILRNEYNCGFSGSINRGIKAAGDDDVVILNSDARVTRGWLQSLLLVAYSRPRVATVTPMSDRAGAFSAPAMGYNNPLPFGATEDEYAVAFRRASFGLHPPVPTGNGFCMFIRRECLQEIGLFDAAAFPRGYGEENDFCMRALRAGWVNLVDDSTYIFHERAKSFREENTELRRRGNELVRSRYPEYKISTSVFAGDIRFMLARYAARVAAAEWRDLSRPAILYVISTTTGGTPQTNLDLMREMEEIANCYLLQCDSRVMRLYALENAELRKIQEYELEQALDPVSHISDEYDAVLAAWLHKLDINLVHIRHLVWHSLNLPAIAKKLGCHVVYSFHDYYALSPNHNLVDDAGIFCGDDFLAEQGSPYRCNLWQDDAVSGGRLPVWNDNFIKFWRKRFLDCLSYCDAYVITSSSAAAVISSGMPGLDKDKLHIIPHGRNFANFRKLAYEPRIGEKINILVLGNINYLKGLGILQSLAAYDKCHENILNFHILGNCKLDNPEDGIFIHGQYTRDDVDAKIAEIKPSAAVVFSIWNETWCHTLTESWACGLPVFAFDSGTLADRIHESGCGWLLPPSDIPECYNKIVTIMNDREKYEDAEKAVYKWQNSGGLANNTKIMAAKYYGIYNQILNGKNILNIAYIFTQEKSICKSELCSHLYNIFGAEIRYIGVDLKELYSCLSSNNIDGFILNSEHIPLRYLKRVIECCKNNNIPFIYDYQEDKLKIPNSLNNVAYSNATAIIVKDKKSLPFFEEFDLNIYTYDEIIKQIDAFIMNIFVKYAKAGDKIG